MKDSNCFLEVGGRLETPATEGEEEEDKEQLFLSGLKLGGRPSCREFKVDAKDVSNEAEEERNDNADNLLTSAI